MAYLALGRLRPVFDLRQQRRLHPDATVRDFLRIGLGLPDQRLEPRLQILRRCGVVDLTGVDQLLTLLPGEIKAVPLVAGTTTSPWIIADPARRGVAAGMQRQNSEG